jgi:hypothetical protein
LIIAEARVPIISRRIVRLFYIRECIYIKQGMVAALMVQIGRFLFEPPIQILSSGETGERERGGGGNGKEGLRGRDERERGQLARDAAIVRCANSAANSADCLKANWKPVKDLRDTGPAPGQKPDPSAALIV